MNKFLLVKEDMIIKIDQITRVRRISDGEIYVWLIGDDPECPIEVHDYSEEVWNWFMQRADRECVK